MNRKRKVDKRYSPPATDHVAKWERLTEYKIGRRKLVPGQVVKVANGGRGAVYEFMYAERHIETGAVNLTFVGGTSGHRLVRTFKPERVKQFLYMAR